MKTIRELIEKYQKEIQSCEKEMVEEPEFSEGFEGEKHIYEIVVRDLKEYEKSIYQLPTDLNKCVKIHQPENYPPLRERLICASVEGIISGKESGYDDNHFVAKRAIYLADEIIKQLKNNG